MKEYLNMAETVEDDSWVDELRETHERVDRMVSWDFFKSTGIESRISPGQIFRLVTRTHPIPVARVDTSVIQYTKKTQTFASINRFILFAHDAQTLTFAGH